MVMLVTTVTCGTWLIENLLGNMFIDYYSHVVNESKLQLTPKKYAKIEAFRVLMVFSAKKTHIFWTKK